MTLYYNITRVTRVSRIHLKLCCQHFLFVPRNTAATFSKNTSNASVSISSSPIITSQRKQNMGDDRKRVPAFLSFSAAPFFIDDGHSRISQRCRCTPRRRRSGNNPISPITLSAIRVHVNPYSSHHVATGPAGEEELYIRRNADIRHARSSTSTPTSKEKVKEKVKETGKEEEGEGKETDQFQFIEQQQKEADVVNNETNTSSTIKTTVPSDTSPSPTDTTSEQQQQTSVHPPTATSSTTTTNRPPSIRILTSPLTPTAVDRIRTECIKTVTSSPLLTTLLARLPTRRETLTFAGELALILAILVLLRAGVSSTLRWIHARLQPPPSPSSSPVPPSSSTASSPSSEPVLMPYESSIFECMQKPLEFLSLFTVGTVFIDALCRPLAATGLLRHIRSLREVGMIISATWFLIRWIDRIKNRFTSDKRIDQSQVNATSRFATVATFIISLLISLDTIGVNVQAVLAFGGIGGVAIGFAGREIISNFFGGLMIYVTRPFTVGEWVRCIEEEQLNGTVEDIGWYLTRVRTWDKRPLYIPNSRFSTLIIENGSRMDNRRIVHTIHLRLEDVPVAHEIVAEMEKILMNHSRLDPKQHRLVYVDSFDDYSVLLWFSCYTKSVFLYDFRDVQQELLLKFYDIVRRFGAKLASRNTRDVRPGSNTDKYGPYGNLATFGADVPHDKNDVDAVAQQRRRITLVDNIPYAAVVKQQSMKLNDADDDDADDDVDDVVDVVDDVVNDADTVDNDNAAARRKERIRSEVAITAVVSALAAARRIAARRQNATAATRTDQVDTGTNNVSGDNGGDEVKNDGEMMISKAPSAPSSAGGKVTPAPQAPAPAAMDNISSGEMKISKAATSATPVTPRNNEGVVIGIGGNGGGEMQISKATSVKVVKSVIAASDEHAAQQQEMKISAVGNKTENNSDK